MSIKTFWLLALKTMGLVLCYYIITNFIQLLSNTFISFFSLNNAVSGQMFALILFVLLYVVLAYVLLFKTDQVISLLKLESSFNKDKININVSYTSLLSIAIILLAATIIIDSCPIIFSQLYYQFQVLKLTPGLISNNFILPNLIKIVLAALLLNYHKNLSLYFFKKQENSTIEEEANTI